MIQQNILIALLVLLVVLVSGCNRVNTPITKEQMEGKDCLINDLMMTCIGRINTTQNPCEISMTEETNITAYMIEKCCDNKTGYCNFSGPENIAIIR